MVVVEWEDEGALGQSDRDLIQQISESSEREIRKFLPELDPDVRLSVRTGLDVIPDTGEVGRALAPGRACWVVDHTRHESIEAVVIARLRSTLFHEFHHLVRGWVMTGGEQPKTFMHGVVSEGLATAFERDR